MMDKSRYQRNSAATAQSVQKAQSEPKPTATVTKVAAQPAGERNGGVWFSDAKAGELKAMLLKMAEMFGEGEAAPEVKVTPEVETRPEPKPVMRPEPEYEPKHELRPESTSEKRSAVKPAEPVSEVSAETEGTKSRWTRAKVWQFPDAKGRMRYVYEDNFWEARQLTRCLAELNLVWAWLENGKFFRLLSAEEIKAYCPDLFL